MHKQKSNKDHRLFISTRKEQVSAFSKVESSDHSEVKIGLFLYAKVSTTPVVTCNLSMMRFVCFKLNENTKRSMQLSFTHALV